MPIETFVQAIFLKVLFDLIIPCAWWFFFIPYRAFFNIKTLFYTPSLYNQCRLLLPLLLSAKEIINLIISNRAIRANTSL